MHQRISSRTLLLRGHVDTSSPHGRNVNAKLQNDDGQPTHDGKTLHFRFWQAYFTCYAGASRIDSIHSPAPLPFYFILPFALVA